MRKHLTIRLLACLTLISLLTVFELNAQVVQTPVAPNGISDFNLTVQNLVQTAVNKLEFDVYLQDMDPAEPFELASLQFGFLLNSGIYTGGTLTGVINNSTSGLIPAQQFAAAVSIVSAVTGYPGQTLVRLAGKVPPGAGGGTIISAVSPGTLLTHFVLSSSVDFSNFSLPGLSFTASTAITPLYATRIAQYVGTTHTQLAVTPGVNALVCCNQLLNNYYVLSGAGAYCQGDNGLPVGLPGSVAGEIYTLSRDGIALSPTVTGTGSAISFGIQPAGTYTISGPNAAGSIVIIVNPPSQGGFISGGTTIYEGITPVTLTLNSYQGGIVKWQKRFYPGGAWIDIANTQQTYTEIPVAAGPWYYRALVQSGVCPAAYAVEDMVVVLNRTLLVKVFLQGLYNPSTGLMCKARNEYGDMFQGDTADRVNVHLAMNTFPYSIVYNFFNVGLPTNGVFTLELPAGFTSSYYLVINHRNSIETWNSFPVSLSANNTTYNFTNGAQKAYGYNLVQMGSDWTIYEGDVNQDGAVDSGDMTTVDNDNNNYVVGYLSNDVNGDGTIDIGDLVRIDNNSSDYVSSVKP